MMFFYTCLEQMPNLTARFHERTSSWLDSSKDVLETVAKRVQNHQFVVVGAFSACYFFAMLAVAHQKLFWFDELFTYYICGLPGLDAITAELGKGVDHHPPSYFLLMQAASRLWPDPHIAFRIPSIVGFWLLSICLFRFVARRTSAVYGTLAMLAPYMTGGQRYATEARPYGPAVGLLAMAFLAWQSATMVTRSKWPLVFLAVGIGGAISTSYYSVLALVPLGIAELVRTAERRKIDFPVWLAICAGSSVGLLYLPAVSHSIGGFASDGFARPRLAALLLMYRDFFQPTMLFWLGCLLLVALLATLQRWVRDRNTKPALELPAAELTLAAGLLLLPVLGLAVAYAVTKMITTRYVISAVTGFSMLLSWVAFRAARASAVIGLAITSIALFLSLFHWYLEWHSLRDSGADIRNITALLERTPGDSASLPVVFESPLRLFEASHYSDRTLAQRFVFLTDPVSSLTYSGIRYTGSGLTNLQRYAPVRVDQYANFRQAHPRFLLYETPFVGAYVLPKLVEEGAQLRLLGSQGDASLYLVD